MLLNVPDRAPAAPVCKISPRPGYPKWKLSLKAIEIFRASSGRWGFNSPKEKAIRACVATAAGDWYHLNPTSVPTLEVPCWLEISTNALSRLFTPRLIILSGQIWKEKIPHWVSPHENCLLILINYISVRSFEC